MQKCAAIIVAGGAGKRFGSKTPKQFLNLLDIPVFLWSVNAFKSTRLFSRIVLVAPRDRLKKLSSLARAHHFDLVAGGKERSDSVKTGLNSLDKDIVFVAIHDAARPLIKPAVIERALESAKKYGTGIVSVPARDTIKLTAGQKIVSTIRRDTIWLAQTPQVFRKSLIEKAYAGLGRGKVTDDSQAVERLGLKPRAVMGDYGNIKITDREDLKTAQRTLKNRKRDQK